MAAFEASLVVNVVGELQQKRTLAASHGFLAAARLSCRKLLFETNNEKFSLRRVKSKKVSRHPGGNEL